jgi:Fic family protein
MQVSRFQETDFGRATRKPGEKWAFTYYQPKPLPRNLELTTETIFALSEADVALGLLNGLGRLIQQPEMLIGPFLTREALASSRIEGTKASLTDGRWRKR